MEPQLLGTKYNKIAAWWNERHFDSEYGLKQVEKALSYATSSNHALDVGCGAGGRFVRLLQQKGFKVTGLDLSSRAIRKFSIPASIELGWASWLIHCSFAF